MTNDSPTLRDLVEISSDYAEKLFERNGVVAPGTFHAVTSEELCLIVPMPDLGDVDLALKCVRELFVEKDVVAYAFTSQGWAIMGTFERADLLDPSNHPKRHEVVLLSAESELEGVMMAQREIIRPRRGKPHLGPLELLEGREFMGATLGMLARRTTLQ